ncbi:hypothetical protein IRJ41_000397 [Triplophysa rosa]|uniref:Pyrin domain-containing protein n=1 Tax=Triplophysa rosa TaxID=992332 RepID=A0A9W7WMD8_TRIRA|nr:hypothetical protein IRJ41_000397 [Triplophysa rosa]
MMASVQKLLVDSLDDLDEAQLKRFQWHLKTDHKFPTSGLEKADVLDTADKMVEREKQEGAVKITLDILRKMNQNQLAEELENKFKEVVELPVGGVLVACRAREEDEMSVATSEGALLASYDEGPLNVLPLQNNPQDEADSEMAAKLSQAAAGIGLKLMQYLKLAGERDAEFVPFIVIFQV